MHCSIRRSVQSLIKATSVLICSFYSQIIIITAEGTYHSTNRGLATVNHTLQLLSAHDTHCETTKLFHRDQTVWTRAPGDTSPPPADLPFSIVIPEVGNDTRGENPNTPLPPSFQVGRRTGLSMAVKYGRFSGVSLVSTPKCFMHY